MSIPKPKPLIIQENRCVCCGDVIPEGRQVCPICEAKNQDFTANLLRDLNTHHGGGEGK